MADSFKNVLKRGYLDEFISTCKHAMLVFLVTALFLFTTQMADIYSRLSFYIMFPIYVTITYIARIVLKSLLKKKGFGASRKSLFVIAPDAILELTGSRSHEQRIHFRGLKSSKISISIFIISSKIITICELAQFNTKLKFKIVFNSAFFCKNVYNTLASYFYGILYWRFMK